MIVDSSALPEQVVQDTIASAFDSAGQRCSALRVLCLQNEIADKTIVMLKGAMRELKIGNPDRLATDIGPVIDAEAQSNLLAHIERMKSSVKDFYQLPLPACHEHGTFVAPTVLEIGSLSELTREVFGPVLHVLRYARDDLPQLIAAINASGYGLTLGIHSRIDETIDFIIERAHVGNIYVNRNIVGAVVGVQPFGGEGKSGTGPKAGGPLYLKRLQRNPEIKLGGHTIHAAKNSADAAQKSALDALLAWARTHGHEQIAALGESYRHTTPIGTSLILPGPTGERNELTFAPRGVVLCAASRVDSWLNQLLAVLATDNIPALASTSAKFDPRRIAERGARYDSIAGPLGKRACRFCIGRRRPASRTSAIVGEPGRRDCRRGPNRGRAGDSAMAAGGRTCNLHQYHCCRRQCELDDLGQLISNGAAGHAAAALCIKLGIS